MLIILLRVSWRLSVSDNVFCDFASLNVAGKLCTKNEVAANNYMDRKHRYSTMHVKDILNHTCVSPADCHVCNVDRASFILHVEYSLFMLCCCPPAAYV